VFIEAEKGRGEATLFGKRQSACPLCSACPSHYTPEKETECLFLLLHVIGEAECLSLMFSSPSFFSKLKTAVVTRPLEIDTEQKQSACPFGLLTFSCPSGFQTKKGRMLRPFFECEQSACPFVLSDC